MFKLDVEKARGIRDQIANIHWIIEKAGESQKNIYFWFFDYPKAFDCVDHNKLWKILKEMGISDHLNLPPEKPVCRTRSNSYNWTWNNGLVQNWERSTSRLYTVTLLIYIVCRVHLTSCEMLGWMNHKLESRLPGEIPTTSNMQMIPL